MVVNQKPTGLAMTMPGGLLVGAVWSMGITLGLAAVIAKLVEGEAIAQGNIGYFVIGLLLAASSLGALQAFRKIKRQRVVVCLASGAVYYGMLLAITALFFGGQYRGMGVTALVVFAGCGITALMGLREKKQGRKGKFKGLHR